MTGVQTCALPIFVNQLYCEDIKLGLASLEPNNLSTIVVKGDKVTSSTPNEVKLTATELKPLVQGVINKIIEVAASIMMMIPKSYQYIVEQNGIYLAGGTSKLPGIAEYFKDNLFVDVKIIDEPDLVVAQGGSKFFYDNGKLARMLNIDNLN